MTEIKSDYHEPLNNALEDGTPCLLGTVSADGLPEISPKGSVVVYGTASVVEDDTIRDAIYDMMPEREQKADSGKKGYAVLVKIDRVTNLRGDDV